MESMPSTCKQSAVRNRTQTSRPSHDEDRPLVTLGLEMTTTADVFCSTSPFDLRRCILSLGAEIIAECWCGVLRLKPLEHSALRVRGGLGHQRELDAERLQPVDR